MIANGLSIIETIVNYQPASASTMREGAALEMEAHEPFSTDKVTKKAKVKVFFKERESESVFSKKEKVIIFS